MSRRDIVIAVDGSEQAEYAFNWYVKEIRRDEDYVTVVHCPELVSPPFVAVPISPMQSSPSAWHQAYADRKMHSDQLEQKYAEKMRENGITGVVKVIDGHPGHAVTKEADGIKANAIVIGTRGLGTIRRTIMGSTSDYVLHHAHCPVIICKDH